MTSAPSVQAELEQGIGRLVLDRPESLNALTTPMVERLEQVLLAWADEPVRAITIESTSPRAFCAGGDIRQVRQNTLDGRPELSREFFATEYRVNHLLGTSPVPVVALVEGVCMGGGLGLSVHGSHLVVGDRLVMAMPETSIGFFPDVGATHFLHRLPGAAGAYLGLTGARLDAADALALGLASHHVPSTELRTVPERLAADDRPVGEVLDEIAQPFVAESALSAHRDAIDRTFSAGSVDAIVEALQREAGDGDTGEWAASTLEALASVSRQSLEVTHALLAWTRGRDLRACLDAELRATEVVTRSPDFIEGVRAVLVDKDRAPRWTESEFRGLSATGDLLWSNPA